MKSTTITLLAAAFASLSSAASTAATALPAKFTLSYTSSGTDLPASGTIVKDAFYGTTLDLNQPKSTGKVIITFTSNGSAVFVHNPDFKIPYQDWPVVKTGKAGSMVSFLFPKDVNSGYTTTGLGQVDGGLVWDSADGKGPQSLWTACNVGNGKSLYWDAKAEGCVKVGINVHAV